AAQRSRLLQHRRRAPTQRAQIGQRQRVALHRDAMQQAAAVRVILPGAPGDQEVETEAESRLEDDVALAPRPARREFVPRQEYMLRLRRPAIRAVVDVAVGRRIWRAVAQLIDSRYDGCR